MRGHEPIIDMRRNGTRPAIVFINDYPCDTDWRRWGDHATVDISGDQPEWLDLRFLVGMTVSITSPSQKRAKRVMEACKAAGAVVVAAGSIEWRDGRFHGVWSDVWRLEAKKSEAA